MLNYLANLDTAIFHFLNRTLQNPVFDIVMPFVTDLNKEKIMLILVAVVLIAMLVKGGRHERLAVITLIVGIIFSDQLNSSVAKFILERPRPCHVLGDVRLLVSCGSGFSFPSSHAVNNFCGAVILAFFVRGAAPWLFSFAALVSFSRVYVGVHYPSDVLAGAILGSLCGIIVIFLFVKSERMFVEVFSQLKEDSGGRS
jgi:undecaprenyl-diphosphatase